MALLGDVVLLAVGPRLVALDATDPTAAMPLGQSEPLPGVISAVVARDSLAYVGAGSSVLALNVADPEAIVVLGQLDLDGEVTQLTLRDNALFAGLNQPAESAAGDSTGGVWAIDVSDLDQLRALDSTALPWPVHALALGDNHLFVANPAATDFYVLDVTNPSQLSDPVAVPGLGLTYSLGVAGDVLVAGGGASDLHAWDVTDPLQLEPLWDIQAAPDAASGLGVVEGFILAGERAFLAAVDYNGNVIGVLPVDLPAAVPADAADDAAASKLAVADDRAFFARGDLAVYDVSGASTDPLGRYELPAVADVDTSGDVGIALADHQLLTFTLPDLAVLGAYTGVVHCQPCYTSYLDMALADHVAYVSAADDGLRVIDLADPRAPILIGSLDATTGYGALRVGGVAAGQQVYIADAGVCDGPNLLAFDLTDPAAPHLVGAASVEGCVAALNADAGVLVVAANFADRPGGALTIFTETETGPVMVGALDWPETISRVHVFGNVVLVGSDAGLNVVAISDPSNPAVIAALPIEGGVYDIALADSVASVTTANGVGELHTVDLSDPLSPRLAGTTRLPSVGMSVAVAGEYVLVGGPAAGLSVWRFAYDN